MSNEVPYGTLDLMVLKTLAAMITRMDGDVGRLEPLFQQPAVTSDRVLHRRGEGMLGRQPIVDPDHGRVALSDIRDCRRAQPRAQRGLLHERAQRLGERLVADHTGQPVRAQQVPVAGPGLANREARFDRLPVQRLDQQ